MKKYIVIDKQDTGWWTWTEEEPLTKKEIKELFKSYAEDDEIELPKRAKDFNFDFIQDLWECEIVEYKKGGKNESKRID